jgi:hypothetical protein
MVSQYPHLEALHDYQQPGHAQRVSGWQSQSLKLTCHCRHRPLWDRMEEKVSDQIKFSFVKKAPAFARVFTLRSRSRF